LTLQADGRTLLCIFRVDGGGGYPHRYHHPFWFSRSTDQGFVWSRPEQMPAGVGSARPQLLALPLPHNALLLVGGRLRLMLWVNWAGDGVMWSAFNIAAEHNARAPPADRFCDAFANESVGWMESTGYQSARLQPSSVFFICPFVGYLHF
jgi:hypothetical protein